MSLFLQEVLQEVPSSVRNEVQNWVHFCQTFRVLPLFRIILVGNKVDMLPQDSPNYLKRIEASMKKTFLEKCSRELPPEVLPSIVSTVLVSARTGYNVEKLVSMLFRRWDERKRTVGADIYLLGTTNVGKSSLFNLLLDSDLCKISAANCVEKAMTSPVPGTTLNLLRDGNGIVVHRSDVGLIREHSIFNI